VGSDPDVVFFFLLPGIPPKKNYTLQIFKKGFNMKKQSEGFFGLHFDFHAGSDCMEVGKNVTDEMVRKIIETLKPDYIRLFTKYLQYFSFFLLIFCKLMCYNVSEETANSRTK